MLVKIGMGVLSVLTLVFCILITVCGFPLVLVGILFYFLSKHIEEDQMDKLSFMAIASALVLEIIYASILKTLLA